MAIGWPPGTRRRFHRPQVWKLRNQVQHVPAIETVRQVVQLEAPGDRVRIRLTNELGLGPLQFGAVHVALSSPNGVTESLRD